MPLDCRLLTVAKDADHPGENQDACRVDPRRGRAVIADGVATGIFARRWAELVAEAALADLPNPEQKEAFAAWLAKRRRQWAEAIDPASLAWFQKPKMKQGAFSTLLWMWIDDAPPGTVPKASEVSETSEFSPSGESPERTLHAIAIGDSCLLHVREGRVLRTFPIENSAELEADPLALGSLDLGRDGALVFQRLETACQPGDLVVLVTDAVAEWLLRQLEQDQPILWDELAQLDEPTWRQQVVSLRESGAMRYDDATLAILRVVETHSHVVAGLPTEPPPTPDSPRPTPHAPLPTPDAPLPTPGPPPLPPEQPIDLDLPPDEPPPDWKARLKTLSEEFAQQVGQQLTRGLEQLKKAKHSADEALRRYRDKRRPRDPKE